MGIVPDSTFLIDLYQEESRGEPGPAMHALARCANAPFRIPAVAAAEFLRGAHQATGRRWLGKFARWVAVDARIVFKWVEIQRRRDAQGKPLGSHDAWIAATALVHGCRVMTRDRDYSGIPGLKLGAYAPRG
jgi:predicted nucleic acid-binding protein